MKVTRETHYKRDALRILRMMDQAGFKRVKITGKRGNWLVATHGSVSPLGRFASKEAHYEQNLYITAAKSRNKIYT